MERPLPPPELEERWPELWRPALDVAEWIKATFLADGAPLHNPDHMHLNFAEIAVLWTNAELSRKMRPVAGMMEMPSIQGNRWLKSRMEYQLRQWFGHVPDFLMTLDACYCGMADDTEFCALVEHELYHAAQAKDEFDNPKWTQDSKPKFGILGHDVEEFIGVVARYGPRGRVEDLIRAAERGPRVAEGRIDLACGTCGQRVS